MIQRIQTIFLFLVVVLLVSFNFLPYWQATTESTGTTYQLLTYAYVVYEGNEIITEFGLYALVAGLSAIGALIALLEMFMYKNRLRQMTMSVINSFVMTITIALMAYFIYGFQKTTPGQFEPGAFLLALAMFFNVLARRFIQKDEKLVRSVDRIR